MTKAVQELTPITPGRTAPRLNRRALLAGVSALAAAPIGAAIPADAAPTNAGVPAEHPDAKMVQLCAAHIRARDAYNRDTSPDDDPPTWTVYLESREAVDAARPRTLAGLAALARAAKAEATLPGGATDWESGPANDWAAAVVCGVIRLYEESRL